MAVWARASLWARGKMYFPTRYAVAPPYDTGTERAIFTAENQPFFDLDWTGERVGRTLNPGSFGNLAVFNVPRGGLPGQIVGGMFTQPLTRG